MNGFPKINLLMKTLEVNTEGFVTSCRWKPVMLWEVTRWSC